MRCTCAEEGRREARSLWQDSVIAAYTKKGMARPALEPAGYSVIEAEYPNQYQRMVGFVRSHGILEKDIHDLINDAWLRAMETFDPAKGIDPIQWSWWLLQHNFLPGHERNKKKSQFQNISLGETESDLPASENAHSASEASVFTAFLKENLPDDLTMMLDALLSILGKTDSKHIYQETATQLDIPMKECRNRIKRLRRACHKLRSQWERQQ